MDQASSGRPIKRYELRAARELLRIIEGANSRPAIDAALAMFMMQELEPRRFRSDRAFWAQLVRRVRGVADVSVGRRWDHRADRVRRVYSEVPPKALEYLQAWIVEAFGMAGLRLAELEAKEMDQNARQREEHQSALKELE
ncbi:hypothetical protein U0C82_08655 [Fulvimarina sp. 2208YS6-2-32]|uniref:DUF2267 domain-containing protein n=1 Tax=Fulvimarina uroteuthidis TaxID=3098149 RepID=A0ABU5I1G2_9HYPH|nr:hypothetical protein [Fulvimarina sp. 2208YS6-2-32]MDY8109213.1 hypothetical protein [Fulvimarina sp. 2208YS6-2-32]